MTEQGAKVKNSHVCEKRIRHHHFKIQIIEEAVRLGTASVKSR